jgi:DNA primase
MADFDLGRDTVDQVRDVTDLVEVVSEHVRLRKRGRKYEGLCPFHDEKTPSFSIDPDKGLYYCFGCHRGGDVFKFVMEIERLSFPEAVERLAGRFGVSLPPRSPETRRRRAEADRIRSLLEEAQQFFVEQLASSAGAAARRELQRRGFDRTTWGEFGFGWAPDDWRRLTEHLVRRHPQGSLIAAGLTVEASSGGSPYDRFRKRITFPIRAPDGKIVAFGGRILGDGEPKYLNSPESILFHKRSTLFCLDRARPAIRASGEAVVVEGFFDCLSLHRAGIQNVVATLGTALSADHARLLRRDLGTRVASADQQPRVLLSYDADDAGRRAALAAVRVLLENGVGVAVVELQQGKDPDDVIREQGPAAARELFAEPTPLTDFLLTGLPDNPTQRQRAGAELAELVAAAQDPHTRSELIMELSVRLGFSAEVLRDLARRVGARPSSTRRLGPGPLASGEAMLVRIMLEAGATWQRRLAREIDPTLRSDPRVGRLVEALREFVTEEVRESGRDFVAWLQRHVHDDELTALVAQVAATDTPALTEEAIRIQLAVALREQWKIESKRLTEEIRRAESKHDDEAVAVLQERLHRLRSRRPEL